MSNLSKDVGRALRQLGRAPGFALAIMATLALGFGSVAAIFTIVNAVLIRPLPYADADRLVALHHTAPGWNMAKTGLSPATYDYYRRHARLVEDVGAYNENAVNLTDGDETERVPIAMVSPNLMTILGVKPSLGHLLNDAKAADAQAFAVLISHDLWTRRYGADPRIIGRLIRANDKPLEVIGVLPPAFDFPRRGTAIWYGDSYGSGGADSATLSARHLTLGGLARLRPGVTPAMAQDELRGLLRAMIGAYADATPDLLEQGRLAPLVMPLKDDVIGGIKLPLIILLCATGLVLLISWANVVNLYLVRAESRRRDVALQRALGAKTSDLATAFAWESAMLVLPAALAGLLIAKAGVVTILAWATEPIPRLAEIRLDGAVVTLVIALALVTACLLALLSLTMSSRRDLAIALRGSGRGQTLGPAQRLTQRGLLALQVGLALVVLIGSGVMAQSLWRMRAVDIGIAADKRLTFTLSLPYSAYPTYASQAAFHERLVRELCELPGVTEAATAFSVPLSAKSLDIKGPISLLEGDLGAVPEIQVETNLVTSGYLQLMGIPLLAGYDVGPALEVKDEMPVVISESLAQALAPTPGESLLGRRLYVPGKRKVLPYRVTGVARDVAGRSLTDASPRMIYVPILPIASASATASDASTAGTTAATASATAEKPRKPDYFPSAMTVVVHTSTEPTAVAPLVRRALRTINPRLALSDLQTLQDIVDASMARTRLIAMLLAIGAAAGLLLALVGVFGVTMHLVSSRQREMAVRFALGARPGEVRRLVLRSVMTTLVIGAAMGVCGGFVLTRSLGALLFDVSARDPLTFAGAAAIVLIVGLFAGDVPARRAARIDPARALARD